MLLCFAFFLFTYIICFEGKTMIQIFAIFLCCINQHLRKHKKKNRNLKCFLLCGFKNCPLLLSIHVSLPRQRDDIYLKGSEHSSVSLLSELLFSRWKGENSVSVYLSLSLVDWDDDGRLAILWSFTTCSFTPGLRDISLLLDWRHHSAGDDWVLSA